MMRRLVVSAMLLVAATSLAGAQGKKTPDKECTNSVLELRDACQKAVDLFNYMLPQIGTAMAGGNATLGQASTLGGLGHFSLGVRATVVKGNVPNFDNAPEPRTDGAIDSTEYEMEDAPIPMPAVDLAVGLFKGIPLGITNLGGLDLLLSASYVPEIDKEGEDLKLLTPDGSLKLGFGARLGIVQEGPVMPGVSVTYLKRGLPTLTVLTVNGDGNASLDDSVSLREFKLDASSWRVVASKKLLFIGLAVGYGMDTYDASSNITAVVKETCPITPSTPTGVCRFAPANSPGSTEPNALVNFEQSVTRSNVFANLSLNLVILKLVGEVGQVSGGDITTFNKFKGAPPDKSRQYASVGFRIGF